MRKKINVSENGCRSTPGPDPQDSHARAEDEQSNQQRVTYTSTVHCLWGRSLPCQTSTSNCAASHTNRMRVQPIGTTQLPYNRANCLEPNPVCTKALIHGSPSLPVSAAQITKPTLLRVDSNRYTSVVLARKISTSPPMRTGWWRTGGRVDKQTSSHL